MPKTTEMKTGMKSRLIEVPCHWCNTRVSAYFLQKHFRHCTKIPPVKVDHRICSNCQSIKSDPDFVRNINRPGGISNICRACDRKSSGEWHGRRVNADKARNRMFRFHYGITIADYDVAFSAQGGVCAICGRPPDLTHRSKHLHVDHDHTSKQFRGLLCHHCNHGIGKFMDSPQLLQKAINYLLLHRPQLSANPHS